MTIGAIITGGFSGGVKYIPTMGFLGGTTPPPSFAVVDTFLPKKKVDWAKYRKEKGEIRELILDYLNPETAEPIRTEPFTPIEMIKSDPRGLIMAYEDLLKKKIDLQNIEDEETFLLLM